jgi:hypothetical protein
MGLAYLAARGLVRFVLYGKCTSVEASGCQRLRAGVSQKLSCNAPGRAHQGLQSLNIIISLGSG